MKFALTLLSTLVLGCLSAETIQNVEYQLPQSAKEWKVSRKIENPKGTTIIYTEKGVKRQEAKEFFGAHANGMQADLNIYTLNAMLSKFYPDLTIESSVVEKTNDGQIFEWSGKEGGQEKIHGWGRIIISKDGTVVLGYQTENTSNIDDVRAKWLPVLKNAKANQVLLEK